MRRKATAKGKSGAVRSENHQVTRFLAVVDSRKRKVRGMVTRNGKFYAQMRVALPDGRSKAIRHPLTATRLDEAIKEAEKARTENRSKEIHLPGHRPLFKDLVAEYLLSGIFAQKKESTRQSETQALKRWIDHIGGKRIDWITPALLAAYQEKRLKNGISARTVNLDMSAFNNCMRFGKKHLSVLPKVDRLAQSPPPKRPLLSKEQIEKLLKSSSVSKNADLLRFYIRFLASSGCREQEALRIRREDVDLVREVVLIGWDGNTKNRRGREVQFNEALKSVLTELLPTLPQDTTWLFPSPQRGQKDIHAMSLRESFYATRKDAKIDWVGFHDFRHYFASQCVMAGIDFMTIAKWLGHQDGGILVGKTYGHLNDEHQRKAASKLKF